MSEKKCHIIFFSDKFSPQVSWTQSTAGMQMRRTILPHSESPTPPPTMWTLVVPLGFHPHHTSLSLVKYTMSNCVSLVPLPFRNSPSRKPSQTTLDYVP